ncbi:unnamed protein product, partial [Mesorhabditis belari]|uniref:Uncharacterized protein n=1 Tax=Mesorhabditis belari TaxID=2138241 RepID=A0AAF3FC58_9BILA
MLPAGRVVAVAISKNLVANCTRVTSVACIHHDKSNPSYGVGEKSEQNQMKMSTENMPHRKEAMKQKAKHVTENITDSGMGRNIDELKEKIGDKVYHAKEAVKETAHKMKEAVEGTDISKKAENLKDKVESKVSEAAHEMKGSTLGEKVGAVKEKIGDKVQQAKEAVGEKVDELKMKIGAKEVKTNPEEFVPNNEIAANLLFDDIHDIDRIKAKAEHLTDEQLTDLLRNEMKFSRQPKDHSQQKLKRSEKTAKVEPVMMEENKHFHYDLSFERGDAEKIQAEMRNLSEEQLQAELMKETQKRSKLSDPDPEQFVPRKDIEDNKYYDHIHDTGMMQMKQDGQLQKSLEEILRDELRKRQLPEPDPEEFAAHMEVAENKYFDDIHNIDDMRIKAEHLDKEMEALRKDVSATRDQTPMEEVEEMERAAKSGKMDPFLKEKLGSEVRK